MTAFGTNAITQLQSGFEGVVSADLPLKLFVMLEQLPLAEITSFIGIFWGVIEGAIAVALLLGGGLAALQAAAISAGLPFTIVLLVGCYAIVRGLMTEPR